MHSPLRPPKLLPMQAPLDTLWQAPAVIWVLIAGEGLAGVLALGASVPGDRLVYFGLTSLVVQWTALVAMAGLYLFRTPLGRLKPIHVAYLALLFLVASAWGVGTAMWEALGPYFSPGAVARQPVIARLCGMALIVGMLGVAAFHGYWRARQMAVRAMQSELEALQARIRPHFLFNTLNTGIALVRERPAEAEEILLSLAELFRAALSSERDIPLSEELLLARHYLDIEQTRFGRRLSVAWQVPEDLPDISVPALMIQPLLENAIRHGIERIPDGGRVSMEIFTEARAMTIHIRNPLSTHPSDSIGGHSIGISSTRARIESVFGSQGHLKTYEQSGEYIAELRIPIT